MWELKCVSDKKAADCISVVGSVVLGFAQTVHNDETSRKTTLKNAIYERMLIRQTTRSLALIMK